MVKKTELTDGFIILRPYRRSDISRLYEAACESIPEISEWMVMFSLIPQDVLDS